MRASVTFILHQERPPKCIRGTREGASRGSLGSLQTKFGTWDSEFDAIVLRKWGECWDDVLDSELG